MHPIAKIEMLICQSKSNLDVKMCLLISLIFNIQKLEKKLVRRP